MDLTALFKDYASPIMAVLGFGLGVYNTYRAEKKDRKEKAKSIPAASMTFAGAETVLNEEFSIRNVRITVDNSGNNPWLILSIRVFEPRSALLAVSNYQPVWSNKIRPEWPIPSRSTDGGKMVCAVWLKFRRSDPLVVTIRECTIVLQIKEINSWNRREKVRVSLLRPF